MKDERKKEPLDINRIFMATESAKAKPDWTNDISASVVEQLHVDIMRHIFRYQNEFNRKPTYLLLNRTSYAVYKYIRRGMLENETLVGNSAPDFYEELQILCDPDQEVGVRVLPDAEFAFANLFNTEWDDLRLKYEKKFEEIEMKAKETIKEKEELLSRYDTLGSELRRLQKRVPVIVVIVLFVILLDIILLR